jgi:hypothetical protein
MEFAKDHGVTWRRHFIHLVDQYRLNIDLIDPTDKPGGEDVHIGENKAHQQMLQETGQFRILQQYVHRYRRFDLRFTDNSDFLVVVVDPTIPQWGTANEVYVAETAHHPKFFICEGGLRKLPRWLFDVIDDIGEDGTANVYQSVEEVVAELVALDNGVKPMSDEWVLIRKDIEERRTRRRLKADSSPI